MRRRDVAGAFFIEAEFQQTGSFIYGLYKGSLGRTPAYAEFSSDRQHVIGGPNLDDDEANICGRLCRASGVCREVSGKHDS